MIHSYKLNGYNIVLDVGSGAVHAVDDLAYDVINLYETKSADEIVSICLEKFASEGITEGEIVEAILNNPPATDLDGVKRRTRSGMGRCQGGFCSPTVVEVIARELGVPFESVTKFGNGSVINYGKTKGDN